MPASPCRTSSPDGVVGRNLVEQAWEPPSRVVPMQRRGSNPSATRAADVSGRTPPAMATTTWSWPFRSMPFQGGGDHRSRWWMPSPSVTTNATPRHSPVGESGRPVESPATRISSRWPMESMTTVTSRRAPPIGNRVSSTRATGGHQVCSLRVNQAAIRCPSNHRVPGPTPLPGLQVPWPGFSGRRPGIQLGHRDL